MPKNKKRLTTDTLNKAMPEASPYRIWDTVIPQLHVRVQPSGVKSWNLEWQRNTSRALGKWPAITVEGARTRARLILAEVERHGAPLAVIEARKPAQEATQTLRAFAEGKYRQWVRRELKRGDEAVNRLLRVFPALLEKELTKITRQDVEEIITARRQAGASVATTNRDLAAIKGTLTKAVEWGLLPHHPLERLRASKETSGGVVRYLSKEEAKALRKALADRETERRAERASGNKWLGERGKELRPIWPKDAFTDHLMPMVLLAINTGLRRGELFALTWSHANLDTKLLTVAADNAKSGKARHVPLNTEALDVLARWRKQGIGTGLVFPSSSGGKFDNIQTSWERLTKAAKLEDFRFHDLRHDFASRLVMAGVDLNTVRELLGHSDIKMTLRYAHLAPDKLAEAVAKLAAS